MTEKVGFIGLGAMGRPMALNLIAGGYRLTVYGRRRETLGPLLAAGAEAAGSPAEVAGNSEIIFTMVTSTSDVKEVVLGEQGVISGAPAGSILIDMSTISPSATRMIAARLTEAGMEMLDAPVSGGEIGAKNASLAIMAGGKKEVFDRARPLLSCLGKNIVHVGSNGAGQVAKACNQLVLLVSLQALAEAAVFARANNVDLKRVLEALSGGMAQSRIMEVMGERMVERNYTAGIEARLHYKDMQIVLDEAYNLNLSLPGAALVTQMFNALIGRGCGREDSSQLAEVIASLSKTGY